MMTPKRKPAAPKRKAPSRQPNDGLIDLPSRVDARGRLMFLEGGQHIPFDIRRIFTIFGVAPGYDRGHHAHYRCRQLLIPVAGAVTVVFDDGRTVRKVRLTDPTKGILIEPMVWHTLEDFAPGTVCLVLASLGYDERDYIRDHAEFRRLLEKGQ